MLLIVSIPGETTVPPVHRGCEGSKRLVECSLRTGGGREDHRAARGGGDFRCSNANGGLLYWLVEGAEASREGEADLVLALSADELLIDAVAGSTGYLTQRMIP